MNQERRHRYIPSPLLRLAAVGLLAVGCRGRLPTPTIEPSKPKVELSSTEVPKPTAVPTPVITVKVHDKNAYVTKFLADENWVHTMDISDGADKNLPEGILHMLEYGCSIENIKAENFRYWRVKIKNPANCLVFRAPEGLPKNGKRYRESIKEDWTFITRLSSVDFMVSANTVSQAGDAYIPDGVIHLQRVGCEMESSLQLSFRVLLVGVKYSPSCAPHLAYNS